MGQKTKFDRVKEAVRLLKGLIENEISETNDGYMKIKERLDEWIQTGQEATHVINMRTYRYMAHLTLPQTEDKAAEIVLKAYKFQDLYQ
jgi:hypothetical protein